MLPDLFVLDQLYNLGHISTVVCVLQARYVPKDLARSQLVHLENIAKNTPLVQLQIIVRLDITVQKEV